MGREEGERERDNELACVVWFSDMFPTKERRLEGEGLA